MVGGAGLGLLMLVGVTLAGSIGSRPTVTPPAPAPALPVEPGVLSASQPQLEQAVLRPADLPGNYTYTTEVVPSVPATKTTVHRLPESEKCAALLDPNSLLRNTRAGEATGQATSRLEGPAQVTQMLTTYAGDGASATMQELQKVTEQCRDFQTVLDDGTPVRVQVEAAAPVDAETYSIKLRMTGSDRTTEGSLTLRRVGQVLSVLRQLGTDDTVDPIKLLDQTLARLTTQG